MSKGDDWNPGAHVVFVRDSRDGHVKAGATGVLRRPRACRCGPDGERCWDIDLKDGFGIQAHGGDFDLLTEKGAAA